MASAIRSERPADDCGHQADRGEQRGIADDVSVSHLEPPSCARHQALNARSAILLHLSGAARRGGG